MSLISMEKMASLASGSLYQVSQPQLRGHMTYWLLLPRDPLANELVLETADTESGLLESIISRKLKFFGYAVVGTMSTGVKTGKVTAGCGRDVV